MRVSRPPLSGELGFSREESNCACVRACVRAFAFACPVPMRTCVSMRTWGAGKHAKRLHNS